MDGYDGERLETIRQRRTSQRTIMVDARLIDRDGDEVNLSYVVAELGERWWIIDVIVAGGISELAVRRSEYQRLLADGGIEKLIIALDEKADKILTDKPNSGKQATGN